MLSKTLKYLDFKSINLSVRYLSISAFFTGVGLGYFFTLIVMLLKYNSYSDSTIGIIAAFFSFGLMSAGLYVSKVLKKIGLYQTMLLSINIQTLMVVIMFVFSIVGFAIKCLDPNKPFSSASKPISRMLLFNNCLFD